MNNIQISSMIYNSKISNHITTFMDEMVIKSISTFIALSLNNKNILPIKNTLISLGYSILYDFKRRSMTITSVLIVG